MPLDALVAPFDCEPCGDAGLAFGARSTVPHDTAATGLSDALSSPGAAVTPMPWVRHIGKHVQPSTIVAIPMDMAGQPISAGLSADQLRDGADERANDLLEASLDIWEGHMSISRKEAARSIWHVFNPDELCPDVAANVARLNAWFDQKLGTAAGQRST